MTFLILCLSALMIVAVICLVAGLAWTAVALPVALIDVLWRWATTPKAPAGDPNFGPKPPVAPRARIEPPLTRKGA